MCSVTVTDMEGTVVGNIKGNKPVQVIERVVFDKDIKGKGKDKVEAGLILSHWPNNDIWPFKVAIPVLSLAAGATGFFINRTFRNALFLEGTSKISTYLATVGVPAFSTAVTHGVGATYDILEQKTKCSVCVQVRAATLQLMFGVLFPIITSPLASYGAASTVKGVYLPKITKHPKEVLKFSMSVYSTIKVPLGWIAAAQIVGAMGVTYLEQECFYSTILPILEGKKTFDLPVGPAKLENEAKNFDVER